MEKEKNPLQNPYNFDGIFSSHKTSSSINTNANNKLNRPIQEGTEQLASIERNNQEVDELYRREIDKKWSWLGKVTHRSMYDQVSAVKNELVKQAGHYRLAFYKTILDSRLEALNEKCNAGLKMIKANYRKEVSSFLMAKMEEMSAEVKDRQFTFIEMIKEKHLYAETLVNIPSIHKKYLDQVLNEEERYLKFLDSQLVKFESIVDEEIRKYH